MTEAKRSSVASQTVTTVRELTPDNFGDPIFVQGWTAGWLYAIHDDFNDGYPSRTLILVTNRDGDSAEKDFTDSDPAGYPETLGTVVDPWEAPDA